ncbi:hypothetical protein KSP40_PGU004617 [Platanthera guangdongensis]|uniref:Uncharacterized protein n=1 Tax=Platanthera guangdongensis TaxID=2320717 RepID=A0ABR2LFB5_9ASPA
MVALLNVTCGPISPRTVEIYCGQRIQPRRSRMAVPNAESQNFHYNQSISYARKLRHDALICAAALQNARCASEQTQTVQRQSTTISNAPLQNKEKSPDLDDGGAGFPPRDDDGGGGGGGGGGPMWSGGFFFFGLLAFLGLLKDKESDGPYRE